jgi:hypothetical protein
METMEEMTADRSVGGVESIVDGVMIHYSAILPRTADLNSVEVESVIMRDSAFVPKTCENGK